ncbi:MAG TPA: alpha/beta hydrolase [Solirubrobacteraceae bacterium]|nr:alpha/beta hydrolase [Solirubrobacteraceae bacterium]
MSPTSAVTEHRVQTPDGRVLQVLERGVPDGPSVLVHNGTPNSRLMFDAEVEAAERQGIRIISYDRPGYGGSSRHAGRTVGDCADDVRAIAAALGIDRLAVWGISGGGPHAIASAALLPDLVPAVGVIASTAPWGAEGLDYFADMGEMNVEDIKLQLEDPTAARAKCEQDRLEMLALDPDQLLEYMKTLLTPADAEVLTGRFAEWMVESFQSGLAPSSDGWWDDGVALMDPWGFEFDSIRTPVLLRHGRQDRFVPYGHGEWLAGHIPGVQAELTEDDGHLTQVMRHIEHVHEWLLERL